MTLAIDHAATEAIRLRVEPILVANVNAVFNVDLRVLWNRADAWDVVQATFIKVFTRLDQLAEEQRVRPWFCGLPTASRSWCVAVAVMCLSTPR